MNAKGMMEFSGIVGGMSSRPSDRSSGMGTPPASTVRDRILDVRRVPGGPVRSTFPKRTRANYSEGDLADRDL